MQWSDQTLNHILFVILNNSEWSKNENIGGGVLFKKLND